tara:strand:- start:812 stop:1174 length:363 start_codon:yes stop_codon:yes gene_type:complete
MFGISAFAAIPFATVLAVTPPAPPAGEIFLGGHFGFDERDASWEKEKTLKAERRVKLKTALFGLPIVEREILTTKPLELINNAAQTSVNYDQLMQQINGISANIQLLKDDQDIEDILEFI